MTHTPRWSLRIGQLAFLGSSVALTAHAGHTDAGWAAGLGAMTLLWGVELTVRLAAAERQEKEHG